MKVNQKRIFLCMWAMAYLLSGTFSAAFAACSGSIGKVTLNEYNYIDGFVEIKLIDPAVNLTGWSIRVYKSASSSASASLPLTGSCPTSTYQVATFASSQISSNEDVVLLDASGNVVDLLRTRTSLPVGTAFYTPVPSCTFVGTTTDLQVSASNKGVDRFPDGVGAWRNTPNVGSKSLQSSCATNTAQSIEADTAVTKTVSAASPVTVGTDVTFTVTARNNGPNTATNILVTDLLPAGLTYKAHSATSGTYTPATGYWNIAFLNSGSTATLTITATVSQSGTITNTAIIASDNTDLVPANNTASASVTGLSAVSTFDAVEVGNAKGTAITTKIAGSAFNLDILALDSAGAISTSYAGTTTIELVDASTSTLCASMTLLQSAGTYTFTGSGAGRDNGRHTLSFTYANAARNVKVRIKDSAAGVIACSTDNFAIRPASFASVAASDLNWQTAGTTRTLYNTLASGGNVHKAGQPFTISANAVNASGTTTTGYSSGSPAASVTACVLPASPATCTSGTVSIGSWNVVAGVLTTATASYSEAGVFTMQLVDSAFASVDAGDTAATCSGYYVCSAAVDIGRFVPDHFDGMAAGTPQFLTFNDATCATRSFTYIGQPFGYVTTPQATFTAKNASGATTQNYQGNLWKVTSADVASPTYSYTLTPASTPGLTVSSGTPGVMSNSNGSGTVTVNAADTLTFTRSLTTPQAAFTAAIDLSMTVSDAYESAVSGNGTIATATAAVFGNIAFDAGNAFRYGRLKLANAYGSELLDLPVPLEAQYWNGSFFVTNTADFCTRIAASNISQGNYRKNLAACETAASISGRLAAGRGNLSMVRPGVGNDGSVDLTTMLGAASGNTCVAPVPVAPAAATSANATWLQGKWGSAANYDQNPSARAAFGIYKKAREFIYLREIY